MPEVDVPTDRAAPPERAAPSAVRRDRSPVPLADDPVVSAKDPTDAI